MSGEDGREEQKRIGLTMQALAWLVFLSNKLTLLILIKYLMVDLYLFFGKLAVDAYDVEYTGEGVINDRQRPGWLTSLMNAFWPF